MNNYIEYFTNYVEKNYDINNDLINKKYYHSLRVAKLMLLLAKKMNISEEDIMLAFKIGLCHDLGRFYEVIRNGSFNNMIFDHGAYSNKILYNDSFVNYMDISEHILFRKAIYNHNKKDLSNDLTKRELLFANMIRDMDKIDILWLRKSGKRLKFNNKPTEAVINNFNNDKPIDIKNINNSTDSTILYLSFIKDLALDESYDMAIYGGYLYDFVSIIDIANNKELFNELISKINERRGKVYVR